MFTTFPLRACLECGILVVALRGLLREASSGYSASGANSALAPYRQGQVSLPERSHSTSTVESLVGDRGREFLVGHGERMLDPSTLSQDVVQAADAFQDLEVTSSRKQSFSHHV